ncbi:hypothetical protein GJAV_G00112120 [Gymnothorax javanicus]|nr:hypothetical protein GJAV_G00112120 [Gymnothorax javanicus]
MMLHCLLLLATVVGDSLQDGITSATNAANVLEGSSVTLSCNYSTSDTGAYLHWYRQFSSSKPEFIILINRYKETGEKEGFTVTHEKENSLIHLEITSAKVKDSALYYCALQPTVTGNA